MATYANGRFSTMTAVFPHPPYHGAQEADKEQLDIFYEDKRHFPLHSYTNSNCVRYGGRHRTLSSEERAQVMGYPKDWTKNVAMPGKSEEYARCHVAGNGFHVPSVTLLIASIFGIQFPATASTADLYQYNDNRIREGAEGDWQRRYAKNTPFDMYYE